MPTEVVMPQMGESIAEGTIVRWIKKVGDQVARDEPLFEISTDKVDAEIPAPAAGTIAEIRVKEGETVPVNSVVALIAPPNEGVQKTEAAAAAAGPATATKAVAAAPDSVPTSAATSRSDQVSPGHDRAPQQPQGIEDRIRQRSSPLVRKIARDHHIDISQLHGTGISGRVTKRDILEFIAHSGDSARAGSEVE